MLFVVAIYEELTKLVMRMVNGCFLMVKEAIFKGKRLTAFQIGFTPEITLQIICRALLVK